MLGVQKQPAKHQIKSPCYWPSKVFGSLCFHLFVEHSSSKQASFCYLFYIRLLPQTVKCIYSVSFAAFRLQCPGCRNSVAFEFRVIPLEHVCFCYLFYIRLSSTNNETLWLCEFRGISTSMPRLPKFSCLWISGDPSWVCMLLLLVLHQTSSANGETLWLG